MNRRTFLRDLAVGTAIAPQLPGLLTRVKAPIPARDLMFVDLAYAETKALDLDTLILLCEDLKRSREDTEKSA